jgi:hypothetical protein
MVVNNSFERLKICQWFSLSGIFDAALATTTLISCPQRKMELEFTKTFLRISERFSCFYRNVRAMFETEPEHLS